MTTGPSSGPLIVSFDGGIPGTYPSKTDGAPLNFSRSPTSPRVPAKVDEPSRLVVVEQSLGKPLIAAAVARLVVVNLAMRLLPWKRIGTGVIVTACVSVATT